MESYLPYILTGCIFYGFGLKWCYDYAKCWNLPRREDSDTDKSIGFIEKCERFLSNQPIEGCLKLVATAVGLAGTLTGGLPDIGVVSPKVVHATIYLFFAFSGLVDVLHFYFPHNVSNGIVKMSLAQSFFVEGFLFIWASIALNYMVNIILAAIVWTTCFAIGLELIWPEAKLLRGTTTLLHGGWIAHMIRMHPLEVILTEKVALAFAWHIAAASGVALCIVTVTRSCGPRLPEEPPEVPIYDYCDVADQRI
ncbi:transmembrane protein 45B-like [Prorops nasuta]|uniref:transmembrane protein 45B-like n=1 Tax=Prorops nasuta TaxID=863751 RepID=UPI0034CE79C4